MGPLPRHAAGLHVTLKILIKSVLRDSLVEWLRLAKTCIWIAGKLSEVHSLLVSDRESGVGIKLNRQSGVRVRLNRESGSRINLNRQVGIGIGLDR